MRGDNTPLKIKSMVKATNEAIAKGIKRHLRDQNGKIMGTVKALRIEYGNLIADVVFPKKNRHKYDTIIYRCEKCGEGFNYMNHPKKPNTVVRTCKCKTEDRCKP